MCGFLDGKIKSLVISLIETSSRKLINLKQKENAIIVMTLAETVFLGILGISSQETNTETVN